MAIVRDYENGMVHDLSEEERETLINRLADRIAEVERKIEDLGKAQS
jgi:hypothetical protein